MGWKQSFHFPIIIHLAGFMLFMNQNTRLLCSTVNVVPSSWVCSLVPHLLAEFGTPTISGRISHSSTFTIFLSQMVLDHDSERWKRPLIAMSPSCCFSTLHSGSGDYISYCYIGSKLIELYKTVHKHVICIFHRYVTLKLPLNQVLNILWSCFYILGELKNIETARKKKSQNRIYIFCS